MSTAARMAAAYAALWAAHDLGDHVVQTDHQAAGKAKDWSCMAGHVGTYTATQALALTAIRLVGVRPGWRRALAALAWSAGTHAFVDRRWPVVELLRRTGSASFAAPAVQVEVRGSAVPSAFVGREAIVQGRGAGPLPLHGPYLADQALHHAAVLVAALIIAGRAR